MTHGLPQTGQKFLWDVPCVWCDVLQLSRKKRLLKEMLISSSLWYFQNGANHVRHIGQKARTGCQRSYLLVDGWEQAIRDGHIL